jgi:hypothetical protein
MIMNDRRIVVLGLILLAVPARAAAPPARDVASLREMRLAALRAECAGLLEVVRHVGFHHWADRQHELLREERAGTARGAAREKMYRRHRASLATARRLNEQAKGTERLHADAVALALDGWELVDRRADLLVPLRQADMGRLTKAWRQRLARLLDGVVQPLSAQAGGSERLLVVLSRLLEVDLALADSRAEKKAAHQRCLDRLKEWEGLKLSLFKIGRASHADYLLAQIIRLDQEAALLRAGLKATRAGRPIQDTTAIRKLLDRQHELIQELIEHEQEEFQVGRRGGPLCPRLEGQPSAARLMLLLELRRASNLAQKQAARRHYLELALAADQQGEIRFAAGRMLFSDRLAALRDRLEAEIGLLLASGERLPAPARVRLRRLRQCLRQSVLVLLEQARHGRQSPLAVVQECSAGLDRELALLSRPADRRDSYRWHRDLLRELAGASLASPEERRELALARSHRALAELERLAAGPGGKADAATRRKLHRQRRDLVAKVMEQSDPALLPGLDWLEMLQERLDADLALAGNPGERQAACRALLAVVDRLEKETARRSNDEDETAAERACLRSLRLRVEGLLAPEGPQGQREAAAIGKKRLAVLEQALRFLASQSPRTTMPRHDGREVRLLLPLLRQRYHAESSLAGKDEGRLAAARRWRAALKAIAWPAGEHPAIQADLLEAKALCAAAGKDRDSARKACAALRSRLLAGLERRGEPIQGMEGPGPVMAPLTALHRAELTLARTPAERRKATEAHDRTLAAVERSLREQMARHRRDWVGSWSYRFLQGELLRAEIGIRLPSGR